MKISMKEFEEAESVKKDRERPLDQRIVDILKQNNDSAYELTDIIEMLEPTFPKGNSGLDMIWGIALGINYVKALSKLETEGKIRKVPLKNGTYYTLAKARANPPFIMGAGKS